MIPIVTDLDRMTFGGQAESDAVDQVRYLDGGLARFDRSYVGEPDVIADELSRDAAVRDAGTLLLTVPNSPARHFTGPQ